MILCSTECWTALSAISTGAAAIVAFFYTIFTFNLLKETKKQIAISNQVREFQVYTELTKFFYSDNYIEVTRELKNKANGTDVLRSKIRLSMLNPYEDVAHFCEKEFISIDLVYSGFGAQILTFCSYELVQEEISSNRRQSKQYYEHLIRLCKRLYDKCDENERDEFREFKNFLDTCN